MLDDVRRPAGGEPGEGGPAGTPEACLRGREGNPCDDEWADVDTRPSSLIFGSGSPKLEPLR
jgi:hypothetical protein